MRSLLPVTLILLVASTTSTAADDVLLGLWKSDTAKTIASYTSTKTVSPEGMQALERMFGKLTLDFGPDEVLIDLGTPGVVAYSSAYDIKKSDTEQVVVEFMKPDGTRVETAQYFFEEDCIKRQFQHQQSSKKWFEYYCRVQ